MAEHHESNKLYEAFDSNAHIMSSKQYESKKFPDAVDAFDSYAHLVVAEHYESS